MPKRAPDSGTVSWLLFSVVSGVSGVSGEGRTTVLLIGAGGHARVCLEALLDGGGSDGGGYDRGGLDGGGYDGGYDVVGAVSADGSSIAGLGVPVLGLDAELDEVARRHAVDRVFVAIGDNAARPAVTQRCDANGLRTATAVSRFAMVSRTATLMDGSAIMPGAVVNAASTIGRGVIVNTNASVDHDCTVGDFVHVAPGFAIAGGVRIGSGTLIGIGARVLPNVTIGARAVVGAGAVVVNDVPDGAMVTGMPARQSGRGGS